MMAAAAPYENFALVVHSPPEPHPISAYLHDHFVQVPATGWLGPGTAKVLSKEPAKLERPAADSLVADVDPSLSQHFLYIPKAQGEPEIEPNRLADDVGRKPMPFKADWLHGHPPQCVPN